MSINKSSTAVQYMFGPLTWLRLDDIRWYFISVNPNQPSRASYSKITDGVEWEYAVSWTPNSNGILFPRKLLISHKKREPVDIIIDWYYTTKTRVSFPRSGGIATYISDFVHNDPDYDGPPITNGEWESFKSSNALLWKIIDKVISTNDQPGICEELGCPESISNVGYGIVTAARLFAQLFRWS